METGGGEEWREAGGEKKNPTKQNSLIRLQGEENLYFVFLLERL